MSLRAFHIFLVISVASLFIFLSYWNYMNWQKIGGNTPFSYMLATFILAIATIFYGIKFYSKTKALSE